MVARKRAQGKKVPPKSQKRQGRLVSEPTLKACFGGKLNFWFVA
jgi:hypothetical protein